MTKNRYYHRKEFMAKLKADYIKEAKELGLKADSTMKIAELKEMIAQASDKKADKAEEKAETKKDYTAKAGKRSEKALKEAEEKAAKEARKAAHDTSAQGDVEANKVKGPAPKTRPKLERRGKNYQKVVKNLDKSKSYSVEEATKLAKELNPSKFDASVELHIRLGVDPRQADQNIRSTVILPHGNGKKVTVAVFAPKDEHDKAKKAGADIIADEEFTQQLDKEQVNFDTLITVPAYMAKLGKYARLLGPKGLMPNPKAGTISTNIEQAVKDAKAGKVEYRVDKQSIVHLSVGKISFGEDKLVENISAFFDNLDSQKPNSLKGSFIKSVFLTTTHGPSIKIDKN